MALGSAFDALRQNEPLAALDLGLASASPQAPVMLREAATWLAGFYSLDGVERWRRDMILTPRAQVHAGRALRAVGREDRLSEIRSIRVEQRDGKMSVSVPTGLIALMTGGLGSSLSESLAQDLGWLCGEPVSASAVAAPQAINSIRTEGNDLVPEKDIVRASGLVRGEYLTPVSADEARRGVLALNQFDEIRISEGPDIVIQVHERPTPAMLSLQGPGSIPPLELDGLVQSAAGTAYDARVAAGDERRIAAGYASQRLSVDVAHELSWRDGGCLLTFLVSEQLREGRPEDFDQNILVLTVGRRAGVIARSLTAPDEPYLRSKDRYQVRRLGTGAGSKDRSGAPIMDVLDPEREAWNASLYGVVVVLMDDDAAGSFHGRNILRAAVADGTIVLLAPAIPVAQPSHLLADGKDADFPISALIDTSLARSPLARGHGRRAQDRRVADIVAGCAVLAARDEQIRADLFDRRTEAPLIMSWSPEARNDGELASESTSIGLLAKTAMFAQSPHPSGRGFAHVDTAVRDFGAFTDEVLRRTLDQGRVPDRAPADTVDFALMDASFPELCVAYDAPSHSWARSVLITAETPSLAFARNAADQGTAVIRYTDRDTLLQTFENRGPVRALAPGEIALPLLSRRRANRGLVVRGVDTRDILLVSTAEMDVVMSQHPLNEMAGDVRRYRVSAQEQPAQLAYPLRQMHYALERGDPAAQQLADLTGTGYPGRLPIAKRQGDLEATWSPPSSYRRYALQDGAVPVVLQRLTEDEVPAQSLFTIDGDASVRALFTSRIFEVWARATMSHSISWSSRFSVTRTFETFPIIFPFEVVHPDGGRPWLQLADQNRPLSDLVMHYDLQILEDPQGEPDSHAKLFEELEAALLGLYDLPPHSSDLDILDRLVWFNRAA